MDEPLTASAAGDAAATPVVRDRQRHLSLFSRIPVTLTLEVASVDISLAELINVDNDSVIELDKLAGEPLDVKVNGILFGKAEVVVVNDKYGLRIIEFNNKDLSELTQ
nr:flagellar motor switch protein FliN [Duffyella gerundensis]